MLDFPPLSVNVDVLDAKPGNYSDADSLVPGKFVAPILMNSKSRYESIKNWELVPRTGSKQRRYVKYRSIGLDLAFSITFDKTQVVTALYLAQTPPHNGAHAILMQSKGFSKIILDLNSWPRVSLAAEKVTVGLSRYAF